jgi:hypothetical protein
MNMESQEKKDGQEGKACCEKSKCCGKALAAFALLAIGGAGGYLAGKCQMSKCAVPAAVEAPAK